MKPLGRIGYETHQEYTEDTPAHYTDWMFLDQSERDAWEETVQAVIEEYERRKDDERQEGQVI